MRPAPPILDVGSGLGFFVECCQRHGTPVVGLELSKEGVAASASRHLPVVRGDLTQRFPFHDNVFGSALAHHVLEHVPLAQERWIIQEVRRVLRPGGLFFAVSPNTFHPNARDEPDHVNLFTPHGLKRELRTAGFAKISLAPNYWRLPLGEGGLLGGASSTLAGLLWKIAPIDRFAASSATLAWK